MTFPKVISLTVTNSCNLRCKMCGQWSEEGYIYNNVKDSGSKMKLADWKKLIDEMANHKMDFVLIRGGEPFLFPGIIELIEYAVDKDLPLGIDSNGTMLEKYAEDLVRIGNMHITFSVDGPEEIHDYVMGIKGSYKKIKENIALLNELEKNSEKKISKSICFTLSRYSYKGLGEMAETARSMAIKSVLIAPYYYFSESIGKMYEKELKENFDCEAFSWKGFHHEESGIDYEIFREGHEKYLNNLGDIENFPFMPFKENDFKIWFSDFLTPVGSTACHNVESLIDIQPDGGANFCIDFPDYVFGNVFEDTIEYLWNSERAEKFREYRRKNPFAICYRCGAKYMTEPR
jgi:MoaA/NifB/PqqE/SkfB family radical SAM enzyme